MEKGRRLWVFVISGQGFSLMGGLPLFLGETSSGWDLGLFL